MPSPYDHLFNGNASFPSSTPGPNLFNTPSTSFSSKLGPSPSTWLPSNNLEYEFMRVASKPTFSLSSGDTTYSFCKNALQDRSGLISQLDGQTQLRVDKRHADGLSTSGILGPERVTLATGSKDSKVKWFRDVDSAGLAFQHNVRHNPHLSSHFEAGVKRSDGVLTHFFRWVVGWND